LKNAIEPRAIRLHRREVGSWDVTNQGRDLFFVSDALLLLAFGTHTAGKLDFSVELLQQPEWRGSIGLFFGGRQTDAAFRCYVVEFYRFQEDCQIRSRHRTIPFDGNGPMETVLLGEQGVDMPPNRPVRMGLTCTGPHLWSLTFGKNDLDHLVDVRADQIAWSDLHDPCTGLYGVYCDMSAARASAPRINGNDQVFIKPDGPH
jgi:hypothetical protein